MAVKSINKQNSRCKQVKSSWTRCCISTCLRSAYAL